MLIRPEELEVPEEDPFRHDALERSSLEPPLTEFVCQASGPFVLALDGGWGTGKTTFIRMWRQKLVRRGCLCLYFNAWETDFAGDPLVALVGELAEAIEESSGDKSTNLEKHLKKTKTLAASIAKRAIPVAVRIGTAGLVDVNDFTEKQLGNLAADIVKDQIETYSAAKSELRQFRDTLGKLVEEVAKSSAQDGSKVVVFVDELDRCRPSYAVELLERIKHLFDISGVVFVLGVDRSQLAHSVRALYGSGFDAAGYLRRFIDIDYQLPGPPSKAYFAHIFGVLGIRNILTNGADSIEDILSTFLSATHASLRTQLQVVSRLRVVLQTIPKGNIVYECQLAVLIFLRELYPSMYSSLVAGRVGADDVLAELEKLPGIASTFAEQTGYLIEAAILVGEKEVNGTSSRLQKYYELQDKLFRSGFGKRDTPQTDAFSKEEAERADAVARYAQNLIGEARGNRSFRRTADRIDLTEPFIPLDEVSLAD